MLVYDHNSHYIKMSLWRIQDEANQRSEIEYIISPSVLSSLQNSERLPAVPLIVLVSGVIKPVSIAYAQSPHVGTGSYLVAGGGEGPVAQALELVGVASGTTVNPWLCEPTSHNPHESTRTSGRGYIQAKSDTICQTSPPPGSLWGITQYLYRSTWRGWRLEQVKISTCPAELGSDEFGRPTCRSDFMREFINWRCTKGTRYNYKVTAHHRLLADGTYRYQRPSP